MKFVPFFCASLRWVSQVPMKKGQLLCILYVHASWLVKSIEITRQGVLSRQMLLIVYREVVVW